MRMRARYVHINVASARDVAKRWRAQYFRDDEWKSAFPNLVLSRDIYERLCALGENPGPDGVAAVIGNKSWSFLWCAGCHEYVMRAVCFGADPDEAKQYCETCIREAAYILERIDE